MSRFLGNNFEEGMVIGNVFHQSRHLWTGKQDIPLRHLFKLREQGGVIGCGAGKKVQSQVQEKVDLKVSAADNTTRR